MNDVLEWLLRPLFRVLMLVVMFESVTNKIAGFSLFKLLDVIM